MAAVARARKTVLAPHLRPDHVGIASINSPMQCMMKEVCAQCLQKHVDPVTGKEEIVFSCFNQDQQLDEMDWDNLAARLRQNTVSEKLTNLWLDRLFAPAISAPSEDPLTPTVSSRVERGSSDLRRISRVSRRQPGRGQAPPLRPEARFRRPAQRSRR